MTLEIYDVLGRRVAKLIDGYQAAGHHDVQWDSRDDKGLPVTSGLYFGRFEVRDPAGTLQHVHITKMLLMK